MLLRAKHVELFARQHGQSPARCSISWNGGSQVKVCFSAINEEQHVFTAVCGKSFAAV